MDHVRKRPQNGKRSELTIDDIKGTGGKAQNADCVILMERTPDRKQIQFQSYSKDFDQHVRILLNVAPKGSKEPKFTYAADLDALGSGAVAKGNANRERVLAAFKPGEHLSSSDVAQRTGFSESTARKHLSHFTNEGRLDSVGEGKHRRYWRPDSAEENRT